MATITTTAFTQLAKSSPSGYTSITIEGDITNAVLRFYWANGQGSGQTESNSHVITADANGTYFQPATEGIYTIGPLPQGRIGVKAQSIGSSVTVNAIGIV